MIDQIKIAIAAVVLVLLAVGTWYVTRDHYQGITKDIQLDMAQAVQKELVAREVKLQEAEGKHETDQRTIDALRIKLDRVQVRGICSSTLQEAGHSDTSAGILSDRVDELFGRLQERAGELFKQCDQMNIDAIRVNNSNP